MYEFYVTENAKAGKPAAKKAPAKKEADGEKKAPAKKAEEQYPAFDANEKPAKGAKSADIAPLA